ncbi:hypothetical protein PhCBS80983_g03850 [Powellomyces hirtus]|uniref:Chitin-binding type-3 domain-containing protein n=1 Tax=Powellomyces hirtus TaxID=109895 RepID=A0A507DZZ6_9FUNG|nr:hypothetical protein PhCBS80983_g03850 [Powellomyces hirtus]
MTQSWEPGMQYNLGDVVEYNGSHYRIIQAHRSQGDWAPDVVPALWGKIPKSNNDCQPKPHCDNNQQQQQHHQNTSQQQQQPPYQQVPQQPSQQQQQPAAPHLGYAEANQQQYGAVPTQVVPQNSNDPRKQQQDGFSIGGMNVSDDALKIGGGILGTAAAVGIGAFAWDKYSDAKEDKAELEWGYANWEKDARRRQGEYLEAIKNNANLPPLTWVLTEGNNIPQGAIRGGQDADGSPFYIGRAYAKRGVHIGKVSANLRDGCHVSCDGDDVAVMKYEILLGFENAVRWIDGSGKLDNIGGYKMVEGGRDPDGSVLYIGQCHRKGSVVPGKVSEAFKGCYIAWDGDSENENNYRFLVYA